MSKGSKRADFNEILLRVQYVWKTVDFIVNKTE